MTMLQQLRIQMAANQDLDLVHVLTRLEGKVRKREREDAIAWKRRG